MEMIDDEDSSHYLVFKCISYIFLICDHMFTTSPIINRVISSKSHLEQWAIIFLGGVGLGGPGGFFSLI